jgi:membrane protein insertase Oxa1/YidC/SpoIIIJ
MRRARGLLHRGLLRSAALQRGSSLAAPFAPSLRHASTAVADGAAAASSAAGHAATAALSDTADAAAPGLIASAADALIAAHTTLSLDGALFGWTASLMAAAVVARAVSAPLLYYAQKQQARAALAAPELAQIQAYLRGAPGTLPQKYVTFRRLRGVALRSAGTSPSRLLPWFAAVNVPVFVTASLAIRALADEPPAGWAEAGPAGWFPDLAAADPTGILPLTNTAVWLLNAHGRAARPADAEADAAAAAAPGRDEGGSRRANPVATSTTQRPPPPRAVPLVGSDTVTVCLQAAALFAYPLVQGAPSGMFVFWLTSGLLTAAQRAALGSDRARAALGLATAAELAAARRGRGPPVLRAAGRAVRGVRAQLEWVQTELLGRFSGRRADEALRADVDAALRRAHKAGRVALDLAAVLRVDSDSGRDYVAVVRRGGD